MGAESSTLSASTMTDIMQGKALNSLKEKMEYALMGSYGLITYGDKHTDDMNQEEYEEWKKRRKEIYRQRFYSALTEDEVRQRNLDKTRKIFNDLRRQWFTAKCSGQCMNFNCVKCEAIRAPLKRELDQKQMELTNLETPV